MGQLMILVRSVRGHSGEIVKNIQRIGQQRLDAAGYPGLPMYSSLFDTWRRSVRTALFRGRGEERENG